MNYLEIIFIYIIVIYSVILHEIMHGLASDMQGDPLPRMQNRLSLNPLKHIDLFGTIILPVILKIIGFIPLGYAKPVKINPTYYKDINKGMAITAAAGPLTNIIISIFFIITAKFSLIFLNSIFLYKIAVIGFFINIALTAINLVPIPPLDGSKILIGFLPYKISKKILKLEKFGLLFIYILVIFYPKALELYINYIFKTVSFLVPNFDAFMNF